MCEIPGEQMDQATRDELRRVEVLAKSLAMVDAFFAPHLARAKADKYAKAAQEAREDGDDDVPWSTT